MGLEFFFDYKDLVNQMTAYGWEKSMDEFEELTERLLDKLTPEGKILVGIFDLLKNSKNLKALVHYEKKREWLSTRETRHGPAPSKILDWLDRAYTEYGFNRKARPNPNTKLRTLYNTWIRQTVHQNRGPNNA